ncbi:MULTISPECIES: response regulator transcription factor [unclassified Frankia]|uniref:response regulator transcription factor n=1 Tax=unclassified Frankia TaxID=2632575 RepID=UPI002024CB6B
MSSMQPSRLLIVDSQRAFSSVIAAAIRIENDFTVLDAVPSLETANRILDMRQVDILLLDVELLGEDAAELARRLRRLCERLPTIVVTDLDDPRLAAAAVRAGVRSWVPKRLGLRHLISVVRGIRDGESWFPPSLLGAVLTELARSAQPSPAQRKLATLTRRERQILQCMVNGLDRGAIAAQLFLSSNTVRTHVQNLLGKLEVHSGLAAVALAARAGIALDGAPDEAADFVVAFDGAAGPWPPAGLSRR